jgi:hypothetical protein
MCGHCQSVAVLSRRKDLGGWRALWWCVRCQHVAFGGDSFVRVTPQELALLPIVDTSDKQGSLF